MSTVHWSASKSLEEEKRQKRVDQMTDHMQQQVDGWAEEYQWSTDTQGAMMDILTDYVYGRVRGARDAEK